MKTYSVLAATLLALAVGPALRAEDAKPAPAAITVNPDHTFDLKIGSDLVARYHYGPEVAKPFLWPLNGTNGKPITRAWPMVKKSPDEKQDHVHQKSAWFCHGDVIPEGYTYQPGEKGRGTTGIDFWAEEKGHGVIACVEVGEPRQSGNHAQVATRNEWRTALGHKIMDEKRTIHLYNLGSARLLVFDIDLEASVYPITFGDTKEGAFGVRVSDDIREDKGKGKLENANGNVGEKECWGYVSSWCDYSGTIDGQKVGIAILSDPANPYPAIWHSRAYGLMAANPFGRAKSGFPSQKGKEDLVHLARGGHLKLRYAILLHPGDAKEGKVAEGYEQFAKLK